MYDSQCPESIEQIVLISVSLWAEVDKIYAREETSLARIAADFFEKHGRPMRVAVDAELTIFRHECGTRPADASGR